MPYAKKGRLISSGRSTAKVRCQEKLTTGSPGTTHSAFFQQQGSKRRGGASHHRLARFDAIVVHEGVWDSIKKPAAQALKRAVNLVSEALASSKLSNRLYCNSNEVDTDTVRGDAGLGQNCEESRC